MERLFFPKERLFDFFNFVNEEYCLYLPVRIEGRQIVCDYNFNLPSADYILKKYSLLKKEDFEFNPYRTIEPLKSFLNYPKEIVCEYFSKELTIQDKKIAIFGVKNCDLFSLKIQDFVFLQGDYTDPLYKKRRENLFIISSDCLSFKEVCFCLAYDINPYPESGFDLNFSSLDEGFLVEVGSDKAKALLEKKGFLFEKIPSRLNTELLSKRENITTQLKEHIKSHALPKKEVLKEIINKGYNSKLWQEEMFNCVECGGCNFICDTCHCFLLSESGSETVFKKIRSWDSCQYANFAKEAGGANPLNTRAKRLRNRFLKKFDFFIDNLGLPACCGCGRCIETCPAKIDIRKILKSLYEESLSAN
ncbi:MAG: 4Fe-4S dicluster domain-containing protein [Candidatus Omnitrophica bacterium]|nr:4Fe-4S dicluster domain-containing protein [Candidatus Omnitrophota bacterium]MCM8799442.1 4Fe-4S dicluster domain-containing protein [Candidatus Omnitrophota bacterium]